MEMNWSTPWRNLSYQEKLQKRLWVQLNQHDKQVQGLIRELCKRDPVMWIELFCWTKDPHKTPASLPFILYPFQVDYIDTLQEKLRKKESILVEKSRQLGISWVTLVWLLYHWNFDNDFVALISSRKEELVDKGGSTGGGKEDTLFYKLDYNLNKMPAYILPQGYNSKTDRRHMLLTNKKRNSVIYGESSNKNLGRGSSLTVAMLDEFAAFPDAREAWDSVSEATNIKIVISTPKAHTFFKTLRFSKQIDVQTIHWRQHPEKDDKWYEAQKKIKSSETLAQEVDLSYDVTGRGSVYEEAELVPLGKYSYDSSLPLYTSSDYGIKDPTAIIWFQTTLDKSKFFIIDHFEKSGHTIDYFIPFYTGIIRPNNQYKYTKQELEKIRQHSKWKSARHFGDPAGKMRGQVVNSSVIRELAKAGIFVFTNEKSNSFPARRDATKILLRTLYVNKESEYVLDCIKNSNYPEVSDNSQRTQKITKPVHDGFSHMRTAVEFFAVNIGIKGAKPRKVNYLKKRITDHEGNLKEEIKEVEKKKRIIRWSWRSYR